MMDMAWDEREAGDHSLAQLAYALRRLAQSEGLSLRARAFSTLKLKEHSLFGEEQAVVYINPVGLDPRQATPGDLTGLRQADLAKLTGLSDLSPEQLRNAMAHCRVDASAPFPPEEALFHAILPAACVLSARVDAFLAISLTGDGPERTRQIFGDRLAVLPQCERGLALAAACKQVITAHPSAALRGLLLPDGTLAALGATPRAAYETLLELASQAQAYLQAHQAWQIDLPQAALPDRPLRVELAALRKTISDSAGVPLVLTLDSRPLCLYFARRSDLAARTALAAGEAAARLVLDAELGLVVAGRTAAEAAAAGELYYQGLAAILRAEKLQGKPLESIPACLESLVPPALLDTPAPAKPLPFTGEVALVTGGASGIGKACVESLLARGAAVVTFDINPAVTRMYDRPDFLGLSCDLTDEKAILACYESMARRFGGLDMLVLNAGIFPAGVRIEALDTAAWQKVMRINLDSNLVIMRESQPLLKDAPRYGRVLVNASKNVLAPGAGAAAYSASKAAVTQLGRVAALEWGKDKIRVNLVHPDAIFDTGIWTEDVLKARAAHYGMTVQQYKTRNVLGVELNSHYVGELVAEMLGPLFEKITGAQIPVDGGSDRVI